jgi:hypothetical protein
MKRWAYAGVNAGRGGGGGGGERRHLISDRRVWGAERIATATITRPQKALVTHWQMSKHSRCSCYREEEEEMKCISTPPPLRLDIGGQDAETFTPSDMSENTVQLNPNHEANSSLDPNPEVDSSLDLWDFWKP